MTTTQSTEVTYTFSTPDGTEIGALRWHDEQAAIDYARAVLTNTLRPTIVVSRSTEGGPTTTVASVTRG